MRNTVTYFRIVSFLLTIGLSIFTACSVRRSEPVRGPLAITTEQVKMGQIHYMAYCQKCHPAGESGLGPAINSKPLPGFLMRFQVRHGLGTMPSFKRDEISDDELSAIIAYIKVLKKNK